MNRLAKIVSKPNSPPNQRPIYKECSKTASENFLKASENFLNDFGSGTFPNPGCQAPAWQPLYLSGKAVRNGFLAAHANSKWFLFF
jgi:hypothetical protein